MSKTIIIENTKFDYDLGCRILKLKYQDCPFPELESFWNEIIPLSFKEICKIVNVEERRIAIFCFGIDRLFNEVNPELLNKKTLKKQTTWVDEKGELQSVNFNDTYELYKVKGDIFNTIKKDELQTSWRDTISDCYFVRCKDTSTNRQYLIWVDANSIYRTNNSSDGWYNYDPAKNEKNLTAIQAIAWTIQTNVPKGGIEKIIRQGDCILIKPKPGAKFGTEARHLTEEEYKSLLVAES